MLIYSPDAEADRAFFRDVLEFRSVDAGHGWLIFAMPPAEAGIHPAERPATPNDAGEMMADSGVYLMCDDLKATMKALAEKQVKCSEAVDAGWGVTTTIRLPSGVGLGLYQPRHPKAI